MVPVAAIREMQAALSRLQEDVNELRGRLRVLEAVALDALPDDQPATASRRRGRPRKAQMHPVEVQADEQVDDAGGYTPGQLPIVED